MTAGTPWYIAAMTGPTYDDRGGMPEHGGEPYPGSSGPGAGAQPPEVPPTGTATVPPRTRVSGIWVASIAAVVVLLLLLIFILQNSERVKINIFGANPTLPLGVALLLAAVLGALLVALIGVARVVQLRRTARRMARGSR
jgi:uncharacterized integral membrane protein